MKLRVASAHITCTLAGLFLLAIPGTASADRVPPDATWREAYIRSGDGTRLHADVFRPRGLGRREDTPVIVVVSPYVGIGDSSGGLLGRPQILDYYRDLFDRAFRHGYSIVQVALRGQGASEGCPDHGGDGEQADARAAVRWAATRKWSTGRVGGWGLSWDGYTQVMNLANDVGALKAAVIMAPVTDAYRGYYMNGVPYLRGTIAAGVYYHLLAAVPPGPPPSFARLQELVTAAGDLECAPQILSSLREHADANPSTPFWLERRLAKKAARSRTPVLFSQGFLDEQTYGDQFLPFWRGLRGSKRAWFGQFPHVVPSMAENGHPEVVGRRGFTAEAFRWLDAHVRGVPAARRAIRADPPVEVQEGSRGFWRTELRWPPRDAHRAEMPVRAGAYLDGPGNQAEPYCLRLELHCLPGVPGVVGAWTLTKPLPYAVHLAGVPKLRVAVRPRAPQVHLKALVYDLDARNRARLVTRGATLVSGSGGHRLRLYPQDWRFERGHRLGLFITGADDDWFLPGTTLTVVGIAGGELSLPFLRREREPNLDGGASQAIRQRSWFPIPRLFAGAWSVDSPLPPPMRPAEGRSR